MLSSLEVELFSIYVFASVILLFILTKRTTKVMWSALYVFFLLIYEILD